MSASAGMQARNGLVCATVASVTACADTEVSSEAEGTVAGCRGGSSEADSTVQGSEWNVKKATAVVTQYGCR